MKSARLLWIPGFSLSFGMEEGSTGGLGASFVPLGALTPLLAQGSL